MQRLRRAGAADVALYRRIRGLAKPGPAVTAAHGLSLLGEHAAVWLALGSAACAVDSGRRPEWARATVSVAAAHALNVAVKRLFRRPRPVFEDLPALAKTPSALSFPSAHAASSFAAARAYSGLLPSTPVYGAAVAMGFSRVYLGVHYPVDVLAGAALGLSVGSAARRRAA